MPHINDFQSFGEALIESVSTALGESFEIILYDMRKPEYPVLQVLGKNISGLQIGDCGRDENFNSIFTQCKKENRIYKSEKKIINGKEIKSTVIFMMEENHGAGAALKINFDLSIVSLVEGFLKECGIIDKESESHMNTKNIDVRNIIPLLLKEGIQLVGKEVTNMSKEDKIKIVKFLDERGAYLLRNSIEDVAKALDITRFTVYNYLDEIRKVRNE